MLKYKVGSNVVLNAVDPLAHEVYDISIAYSVIYTIPININYLGVRIPITGSTYGEYGDIINEVIDAYKVFEDKVYVKFRKSLAPGMLKAMDLLDVKNAVYKFTKGE